MRTRLGAVLRISTLAGAMAVTACNADGGSALPSGWRLFEFDQAFSFQGPETLHALDLQSADSLSGVMRNEALEVGYDYGWHSTSFAELGDKITSSREGELDGRPARFIETGEMVAVHVPTVRKKIRFSMSVRYGTPARRDTALKILQSVQFKTPG